MKIELHQFAWVIGIFTFGVVSVKVNADGDYVAYNPKYFDKVAVSPDTKLLMVSFTPSLVKSNDAILESHEMPSMQSAGKKCNLNSSTNMPDCIFKSAYFESYGYAGQYLLLAKKDDWYQILPDPMEKHAVWVIDRHMPGVEFTVHPLTSWLTEGDSFQVANPSVTYTPIFQSPDDSAGQLTGCSGQFRDGDGLIQGKGEIKGDWIQVACRENDCYSSSIPGVGCWTRAGENKPSTCPVGWIRWRSKDGYLLLYPDRGPLGC